MIGLVGDERPAKPRLPIGLQVSASSFEVALIL